mgnify:CR=1 FL=1|tara:strand:- start:1322 stop:3283 length:1962 start_codon:yes stop_codon:yes gene_type:complete
MIKLVYNCLLILFFSSLVLFANPDTISIQNEFIKAVVNNKDSKGRFSLETTLGNPDNINDNYQDLIYGKPIPWTSYTTLLIDNNPYIFGNEDKRLKRRTNQRFDYAPLNEQLITNNTIISSTSIKHFSVTQKLGFFRNPNTNLNDSLFIEYHVTNTSPETHYFGLRIMLDTKLGQNDGAPFSMGREQVESEIQLAKKDLYDYWQAFDSLTSPNIISQGLLSNPEKGLITPDIIHLANWGSLVDQPWNASYKQGDSFIRKGEDQKDTALALTYDSKPIEPNQTKIFKTVYGLGGISISSGELSLGISAPRTLLQTHDSPVLVIAYLLNAGGYDAYNVSVSFDLPNYVTILKGKTTESFPILQKGKQLQFPLLIDFKHLKSASIPISFSVQSSTFNSNAIKHNINIIKPPKLTISIPKIVTVGQTSPNILITPIIQNKTSIPITDISVFLSGLVPSSLPPFEYKAKTISSLKPGASESLSWVVNSSSLQFPFMFKIVANSNFAISDSKPVILQKKVQKDKLPLTIYSVANTEAPAYITLKLTRIYLEKNQQLVLQYPKKSVKFIDYSYSSSDPLLLKHYASKNYITFQPFQNDQDYLYLHYYVKDNIPLSFTLLSQSNLGINNKFEDNPTQSLIQTLDLTLPTKNDIVRSSKQKE